LRKGVTMSKKGYKGLSPEQLAQVEEFRQDCAECTTAEEFAMLKKLKAMSILIYLLYSSPVIFIAMAIAPFTTALILYVHGTAAKIFWFAAGLSFLLGFFATQLINKRHSGTSRLHLKMVKIAREKLKNQN
jgi:hypothetical protein